MTACSVLTSDVVARRPDSAPVVSRDGDRTVVWLEGEFDIATAGVVTETLTYAISLDDGDLTVDLGGVTFIGVVTIDALVQTRFTLGRQSRTLTVRSPSRSVTRILTMCGHADLMEMALA